MAEPLGNTFFVSKLSNAVFATQAVQDNNDFLFRRILFASCALDVFVHFPARLLRVQDVCLNFHSSVVTIIQKHSLIKYGYLAT